MKHEQAKKFIRDLLALVISKNGSDLFITADFPPAIKIDGQVITVSDKIISSEHAAMLVHALMSQEQIDTFTHTKECNFSIAYKEIGRFRVSAFMQQSCVGMVIRVIKATIPNIDTLGLPTALKDIAMAQSGLVLLVGATGSGKSTTMASLIDHRNTHSNGHIITIEDPVEFIHPHKNCIVTHRDIDLDTKDWGSALKNALRQAPNVVFIGEIRDREAMEYALSFAETGHLCLSTLHANNTNQALERILHFFPEGRHNQILMDLSLNLQAIISQRLIPLKNNTGRCVAIEILINSPLIADYIFKGNLLEIKNIIKESRDLGMQTFDQSLFDLYEADKISYENALRFADSHNNLRLLIKLHSKHPNKRDLTVHNKDLDIL